ncbi:MAG: hypothetical protein ACUZ8H_00150 [Candidatus Anammoxibacter sp.]
MIVFETSDETNDPEKVNKALSDVERSSKKHTDLSVGKIQLTNEVLTQGSVLDPNKLTIEDNETNKRLVININGKNYKIAIEEI